MYPVPEKGAASDAAEAVLLVRSCTRSVADARLDGGPDVEAAEDTANTVSSTIPIVLERALCRGQVRPGDSLAPVGFGVGYSWAAAMMEWIAV